MTDPVELKAGWSDANLIGGGMEVIVVYLEGDISAVLQEDGTDGWVACPGCEVQSCVAIVVFVVKGNLVCHHVLHHPANHLPET